MVDTGVLAGHPHFAETSVTGDINDPCGHGTAMAGIVTSIAPQADILSIDVDLRDVCQSSHLVISLAIHTAVDLGADIVLVSWNVRPDEVMVAEAVHYANEHGVEVVLSDGLESSRYLAPKVPLGYHEMSGSSVTAALRVGQLARNYIYLPYLRGYTWPIQLQRFQDFVAVLLSSLKLFEKSMLS